MNLGAMNLNLNLPGTSGTDNGGPRNNLHLSDLPGVSINSLERNQINESIFFNHCKIFAKHSFAF